MTVRLVLLPGTLCDQRLFAPLARRLRPAVAVKVARWRDLLGHRPASWWRTGGPISLLGFSLGGIWALQQLQGRLLGSTDITIERLALVGSNADPAGHKHHQRAREQLRLLRTRGPVAVARTVKGQYFAHPPKQWQARLVIDMARRTPLTTARKQIHLAASRADSLHAFANFPGPVAVMSGVDDRLCQPSQQWRLQSVRCDALTRAWSRCGHMLPLEAPGRLAVAIQRWLALVPEPRATSTGVPPR